jgi:glycosyltransferase involved in cell wall biosynthesis
MPTGESRVVVSNGFNKFHLAVAASELSSTGDLTALITGVYPSKTVAAALRPALGLLPASVERMVARREALSDRLVRRLTLAEALHLTAMRARRIRPQLAEEASHRLNLASFRLYARGAARIIRHLDHFDVYHYRAGFGHASVDAAKSRGALTLCDQSLAHPYVIPSLLRSGRIALCGADASETDSLIADDVKRADQVIANSDFVRDTMLAAGWPGDQVHVVYSGVDNAFFSHLESAPTRTPPGETLRLLFAGHIEERKGFHVLADALRMVAVPWELTVAGPVSPDMKPVLSRLAQDSRVRVVGSLSRHKLAAVMRRTDCFVFPTLAEGSARVVFEALAAGCFVITTPNAGSVVRDGEHGRLVEPMDARAVAEGIGDAWEQRDILPDVARGNALLVSTRFRQSRYGDDLRDLYHRLLSRS